MPCNIVPQVKMKLYPDFSAFCGYRGYSLSQSLYNKTLGITTNILRLSNSKMYGKRITIKNPRYSGHILPLSSSRVSFPSSSRGHRVHAHLSYSSFSYPFKLLPHSLAYFLRVMHCVVFSLYWLKVRSLAEGHNWLELNKFSKARKSLIGYEVSSLTIYVFRNNRAMC